MGFQKSTLKYLIKQGNERLEVVSLLCLLLILMHVVILKEKLILPFWVLVILIERPPYLFLLLSICEVMSLCYIIHRLSSESDLLMSWVQLDLITWLHQPDMISMHIQPPIVNRT